MKSKGCFFSTVLNLLVLSFSISILVFYILTDSDFSVSSYHFLYELGVNWKNGPILELVATKSNCTELGMDYFMSNYWMGIENGCMCDNNILLGKCDRGKGGSQNYCMDIKKINPVKYTTWKNKSICAKRTNKGYLGLTVVSNNHTCPDEQSKKCGIVDTLDGVLCVKKNESCPINSISFLEMNSDAARESTTCKNNSFYKKCIDYRNDHVNDTILSFIKVSDDTPCIDPAFQSTNNPNFTYILDYFHGRESCKDDTTIYAANSSIDSSYVLLDSNLKIDLFKENGIFDSVKTLPQYSSQYINQTIGIYAKGFIGLQDICKSKIQEVLKKTTEENFYRNLIDNMVILDTALKGSTHYFESLKILAISQFVFICIWFVMNIIIKVSFKENLNSKDTFTRTIFLILGVSVIASIIAMGISLSFTLELNTLDFSYEILENCLDDTANILLDKFEGSYSRIYYYTLFISAGSGINATFILLELLVWCLFTDYNYNADPAITSEKKEYSIEINPDTNDNISTIGDLKNSYILNKQNYSDSDDTSSMHQRKTKDREKEGETHFD